VEPRGLEPLTPCLQSKCATNCAMAPDHAAPSAWDDIAECSLRNGTYQMTRDIPSDRDSNPINERSGLKPRRPRTSMASVAPFQLRRWTRRDLVTRLSRAGPKKMLAEAHPPSSPGRRTTLHHRDRSNNSQNRPRAEHASAAPGSVPDDEFPLGGDSAKDRLQSLLPRRQL
jgi:hypothetical protein